MGHTGEEEKKNEGKAPSRGLFARPDFKVVRRAAFSACTSVAKWVFAYLVGASKVRERLGKLSQTNLQRVW